MTERKSAASQLTDHRQSIFDLMGQSAYVHQIHQKIRQVADTDFTVILEGETGTGKELVARLIHEYSSRAKEPFLTIDCGAIPETLLESELFGYVRGAFTGAESKKAGYFELARGGMLFLDEIANLPLSAQTKLLRCVQERCFFPLGNAKHMTMDARIIVASNAVLEAVVRQGHFRGDLFHRLNEFKIYLLPLRQRRDDILLLAQRFRREANAELGKNVGCFSAAAQTHLMTYDWLGNVRELRNTIRRAVLLADAVIERNHLSQVSLSTAATPFVQTDLPVSAMQQGHSLPEIVNQVTNQVEKALIQHVLQQTKGNKEGGGKTLKNWL